MSLSTTLSKLSRLTLLSLFCAGLFVSVGDLRVGSGGVEIGGSGVDVVVAAGGAPATTGTPPTGGVTPAPATTPPTETKDPVNETINAIISFLNLGIGVLTFCITPLIMLAGWLLSPDWTFGEIFGLRPILHSLWILISNVVYVIFGFMLVFIAFANIFGGEHSKAYEMKTMLPKLVTGMLMVPFTWFIVSAVLSVSNVLTASVISLPMETVLKSGGETSKLLNDKIIPKNIKFDKSNDTGKKGTTNSEDGKTESNGAFSASKCSDDTSDCISIKEFLTGGGGGAYNLLSVYAYGIFRIQEYKNISVEEDVKKILDIAYKLGFGTIFFLIFGILVIAIVYALFSRAIMLWMFAIFSPIFALNYVIGKSEKVKGLEHFSVGKFISLAMVPVYVSAALAFGLMFLGLVMGATSTGTTGAEGKLKSNNVDITTDNTITTFKFGTNDNGITLTTVGLLDPKAKNGASKALDIGKGIIGTIIMNVLALAILWMAVMAALGADEITKSAVAPIQGFGAEIGKLAMKAPQYIPIPLPKSANGEKRSMSMVGMQNLGSGIHDQIKTMANDGSTQMGQKFGEKVGNALGLHSSEITKALGKINAAAGNATYDSSKGNPQELAKKVRNVITSGGVNADVAIKDMNIRAAIVEQIRKAYNLKSEDITALGNAATKENFDIEFRKLAHKHKDKGMDYLVDNEANVNGNESIASLFNGSGPSVTKKATPGTFTPDATKPNNGTILINLRDKPDTPISVKVENKIINHDLVIKQLKENGIIDKAEIDIIIKEVEEQLK